MNYPTWLCPSALYLPDGRITTHILQGEVESPRRRYIREWKAQNRDKTRAHKAAFNARRAAQSLRARQVEKSERLRRKTA